jgi:hypothetical protein
MSGFSFIMSEEIEKELNLVACTRCALWDDKRRYFEACSFCHNTKKVIAPETVLCNMCGGPQRPLGTHNEQYPHGLEKVSVEGGYDSYHLFDCTSYTFSFCEKCLRELFTKCKIPPTVCCRLDPIDSPTNYAQDLEEYEYRLWKDNGGHHQAYLNKTCNLKKDCHNKAVYTRRINGDFSEDCSCEDHKTQDGGSYKNVKFIPNVLKPFL